MNNMKALGARGQVNMLLVPLVLAVVLLFSAVGFGYWAYGSRQDYKNNVDQKISVAVQQADQQLTTKLNAQFAQAAKSPYNVYNGPEAFGSLRVTYPRTWSSYVAEEDQSGTPIDGYFYPGTVPDVTNQNNSFALRVQISEQSYSSTLQQYQSEVQQGQATVKPYALPKVPSVVGVYITGQVQPNKQGEMVMLPLRSQTLLIWTEAAGFESDFNNIILPNFSFSP
jgi:hypothetical protein